jgi:WS/DGAT/MGAT family acyltransferase
VNRRTRIPLRAEDALFLHAQTPLLCQQVGAVVMLEPAKLDIDDLRAAVRDRVRAIPELRRRLVPGPGRWRRPCWVPDHDIDFTARIREVTADHAPSALGGAINAFFSQWCDPRRHPWEILLIRDAARGGGAVITVKLHHALGDSHTIMGALTRLFDGRNGAGKPGSVRGRYRGISRARARSTVRAARGLWHLALAGRAPDISVCGSFTDGRRRYLAVDLPARDVARTARGLGCGIAELLAAMIGEAVGQLLRSRGEDTTGRIARIAMPRAREPLAAHGGGRAGTPGNRTAAISVEVPIGPAAPAARLAAVRGQTATHVRRGEDTAAAAVLRGMNILPPPLQRAVAARLYQRRWFNMLLSVFPGVRRSYHLLGARVARVYPVLALADGVGLAIGTMTWEQSLAVGILADAALVPDADRIAAGLARAFERYQAAAHVPEDASSPRAG